jgi:hypothetical protein
MASTWAATANNETISFNNLQNGVDTGVLSLKAAIPVSNEQITKADANTYVNIDTSFAPYAAKASNQLVVKSNLKSVVSVVFTNSIIWFGIANNETTSSPIQLLCGWNDFSDDGRIYRSTNYGSSYASVLTINQRLYKIGYLPDYRHASYLTIVPFVAVGEGGRIVTNSVTDATSWITISSPTTQDLFDIAFQTQFTILKYAVIVGNSRILRNTTSQRINAWTVVNSTSAVWRSVATNGQFFVAVGDNSALIGSDIDATSWASISMPPLVPSKQLRGIAYSSADAYYYVVGFDTANPNLPYIMRGRTVSGVYIFETYITSGDSFLSALTSIEFFNDKLYVGGVNYQYIIDIGTAGSPKNVVTRFDASFSGYSTYWMSSVKDPSTNGFDMAASVVISGNEFNGEHGGHSNF